MAADIATVGAIISVAGAAVALVLSIWTAWQARQAQQVAAYRAVHDLYNKMIQIKFDHPELLVQAREWDEATMGRSHDAHHPGHEAWAQYHTFIDLSIGFANAVLQSRSRGLMGRKEFEDQWERLVRMVITEHYPVISGFIRKGPYVSQYVRDYVRDTTRLKGWDWHERHRRLTGPDGPARTKAET